MDVRCERCKAQYTFDDEQVGPDGHTVRCTRCGHTFRVVKKELVVTLPVRSVEGGAPAGSAKPAPAPAEGREWLLRRRGGKAIPFRELTSLQRWIVEGKVARDDEISSSGESWRRLGEIGELAPFFEVVEAASRVGSPAAPSPPGPPELAPPARANRPPTAAPPPPPTGRDADPAWAAEGVLPPVSDPDLDVDVEVTGAVVTTPRRGRRVARLGLALALLAAAGGAAAYYARERGWFAAPTPVASATPPPTAPATPAPTRAVTATPTPTATPTAVPAATPTATPAATPAATLTQEPAIPAPDARSPEAAAAGAPQAQRSPAALIAQANRLRRGGEVRRALAIYERVIAQDPANAAALVGRGLSQLDLSRYPGAAASFAAALEAEPRNPDALLGLAETSRWQGKKTEAIGYFERYLAEHPDGDEAQVARNAIDELRRSP